MNNILIYLFLTIWPIMDLLNPLIYGLNIKFLGAFTPTRIAIFVILNLTLFKCLATRKRLIFDNVCYWSFIFIVLFLFNLFVNGSGPELTTSIGHVISRYGVALAAYFIILNSGESLNHSKTVKAIVFSGLLIAGIGVIEFILGHNLLGPLGNLGLKTTMHGQIYRTNGPFDEAIGYSAIVLLFLPFVYYYFKIGVLKKTFSYFCIVFFAFGCLCNLSRAPAISLIIVTLILLSGKNLKSILINLYIGLILFIIIYLSYDWISTTKLFTTRLSNEATVVGRWEQYLECLKLFFNSPILGIGHDIYLKTHNLAIHNSYLRILVELGIFNFITYIGFIISLIFKNLRISIINKDMYFFKSRLSLIICVLLIPNTIDLLGNSYFTMLLVMMIALMNISFDKKIVAV